MWVINLIFLSLALVVLLVSQRNLEDIFKNIDKKEHKLYLIYPLANFILTRTGLFRILNKNSRVKESVNALDRSAKTEDAQRLFWCGQVSQVILVLMLIFVLVLFGDLTHISNQTLIGGKYLQRPEYGEGSRIADLKVLIQGSDASRNSDQNAKNVKIIIGERVYTEEEVQVLFTRALGYLKKAVLGNNHSFASITENLNFPTTIPDTSIKVEWLVEDYDLIRSDGTICYDAVSAGGTVTHVTVLLHYYEYSREELLTFTVKPKELTKEEKLQSEMQQKIKAYSEQSLTKKLLELPDRLGSYELKWKDNSKEKGLYLWGLGMLLAVFVWFWGEKELEQKMKQRKNQMLLDYPEIINKFTLLVNAGATMKQAWYRIAEDYMDKSEAKNRKSRYAYEEMVITYRELKLGISEHIAYAQFGRRTGLLPYIKFSSLVTQNLRKGTKGFTELLMKEALDAFEERKEIAKRLGEEAGTKLLIPMMILLLIVFLIIMIPAFLAFQI